MDAGGETGQLGITGADVDLEVGLLDGVCVPAPADDSLAAGEDVRDDHLLQVGETGALLRYEERADRTVRDVIALAEYFISHSLTVFDSMGADRIAERARTVLEVLRTHGQREVSKRDLMVKLSRSEFRAANDLDPVSALLEDHGYVRAQAVHRTGGRGWPPSPRYVFRGPARGPLASGPGMTVPPCRTDDLGGGVTGPERRRWRR